MKNFSFDFLNGLTDVYFVTVNGNELVSFDVNKKPCLRVFNRFSKRGSYVELWYRHSNGSDVLVSYSN